MKAVLISIQPRHCENIASGKKTVEVRKAIPMIPTPFKCYIYCTKKEFIVREEDGGWWSNDRKSLFMPIGGVQLSGKVIGEFVCDRIDTIRDEGNDFVAGGVQASEWHSAAQTLIQAACLTEKELKAYLGNRYGYGWRISDLKIYDKPKELSEFSKPECVKDGDTCFHCRYSINVGYYEYPEWGCDRSITRPPQSWCYVEELK